MDPVLAKSTKSVIPIKWNALSEIDPGLNAKFGSIANSAASVSRTANTLEDIFVLYPIVRKAPNTNSERLQAHPTINPAPSPIIPAKAPVIALGFRKTLNIPINRNITPRRILRVPFSCSVFIIFLPPFT